LIFFFFESKVRSEIIQNTIDTNSEVLAIK